MADGSNVGRRITPDGFGKFQPLTEGYIAKGGRNLSSKIIKRPPAPPLLTQNGRAPAPAAKSNGQ